MPRLAVTAGLRVEGDRAPAAAEAVVARGREVAVVGRLFAREEQSPASMVASVAEQNRRKPSLPSSG
jgi:hypothetical protein